MEVCSGCSGVRGKAQWACTRCTYRNVLDDPVCAMCSVRSPFFGEAGAVTPARSRSSAPWPGPSQGGDDAAVDALLGGRALPTAGNAGRGADSVGPAGAAAWTRGGQPAPASGGWGNELKRVGEGGGGGPATDHDRVALEGGGDEAEEGEEEEEESDDGSDGGLEILRMAREHGAASEPGPVVDVTKGEEGGVALAPNDDDSDSDVVFMLSSEGDWRPGPEPVGGGVGGEEKIEDVVDVGSFSQAGASSGGQQQPSAAAMAAQLPYFQPARQCPGPIQYSAWFGASSRDTKVTLSSKLRTEAQRAIDEARRGRRRVPGLNGPADRPAAMASAAASADRGMSALQLWLAAPPSARRSSLLSKRVGKGRRGQRGGRGRKRP